MMRPIQRRLVSLAPALAALAGMAPDALGQGCACARGSPSIGTRPPSAGFDASTGAFLAPGELNVTVQYSQTYSDEIWLGTDHLSAMDDMLSLRSSQTEITAAAEFGIAERLSLMVELPYLANQRSLNAGPPSGGALTDRLVQENSGLGDIRTYFRYWLLDDLDANLSISAGVKLPTGDERSGELYQGRFLYDDVSIQKGTGSWDFLLGAYGYKRFGRVTPFAGFFYRLTPQEQTSALALDPLLADPNSTVKNSISDVYNWDVGVSVDLGSQAADESTWLDGLVLNLGLNGAGAPRDDLIGGDDGFRRAYNAVFIRSGLYWTPKPGRTLFVDVPVTIHRDLTTNPGSFPDYIFNCGLSFRF